MMRRALLLLLATGQLLFAQRSMDNERVIQMVESGLPEEIVVKAIQSCFGKFAVSPKDVGILKDSGVSDQEIVSMIRCSDNSKHIPKLNDASDRNSTIASVPVDPNRIVPTLSDPPSSMNDSEQKSRSALRTDVDHQPKRLRIVEDGHSEAVLNATSEDLNSPSAPESDLVFEAKLRILRSCPQKYVPVDGHGQADLELRFSQGALSSVRKFKLPEVRDLEFWNGAKVERAVLAGKSGEILLINQNSRLDSVVRDLCRQDTSVRQ